MVRAIALLALASSPCLAAAEEAVLLQFRLLEVLSEQDHTESEFGFLVDFGKEGIADVGNTARVVMRAADEAGHTRLSLTLFAYLEPGTPTLIGTEQLVAPFGEESSVTWRTPTEASYELAVNPQRANPPASR